MSEFALGNGLHFIVLERHNAPVVSCSTYANVGAFDEETGKTGEPALSREAVSSVLFHPTLALQASRLNFHGTGSVNVHFMAGHGPHMLYADALTCASKAAVAILLEPS